MFPLRLGLGMQAYAFCWMELRLVVGRMEIEGGSLTGGREGRKYRLERRSNEAGRFHLCSVHDFETKILSYFPRREGVDWRLEYSSREVARPWSGSI